ncbi:permease [Limibacillus halophilus]|uniref:Permease n=1 Tax=Limibacillus halophilus TaxID=1579333 RepID=A0A839SND3_9PROT|nr:permease [Limibacillus halophilus]MBB3064407.1 hypothetical protein [Limibacillus halophilus]
MSEVVMMRLKAGFRKPDLVILAIVGVLLLLWAVDSPQALESAAFTLENLWWISPFLLASVVIAGYAQASGADSLIAGVFKGRVVSMIFLAAFFGGLSPFCSCGVIPLIAALLAMGVPLAPVMAFWLSSPVIDPAMFVLTAGTLGTGFAVAKTLAAIGAGLLGGFFVHAVAQGGFLRDQVKQGAGCNTGCGSPLARAGRPNWAFWQEKERRGRFATSALDNTLFLGKWLTLAFLLESLMLVYLPGDLISQVLGGSGVQPVVLATLVGVPAYLNGYAALPLVAGLIGQGMQPGAGLAFLVAGGITSIPAAMAVFALVRVRLFLLYLVLALTASLASGLIYNLVV